MIKKSFLVFIFILVSATYLYAYNIQYSDISASVYGNGDYHLDYALGSNSFSISDVYDVYADTTWTVKNVYEDPGDGIMVDYMWEHSSVLSDAYVSQLSFTFKIVSDYGNLNQEAVQINALGSAIMLQELYNDPLTSNTCCSDPTLSFSNTFFSKQHSTEQGLETYLYSGSINESSILFTNTTYTINYWTHMLAEAGSNDPIPGDRFNTWDDYHAFIAATGGSGFSYTSVDGLFDYQFSISTVEAPPIPEPSTLCLFSFGFTTIAIIRKFRLSAY